MIRGLLLAVVLLIGSDLAMAQDLHDPSRVYSGLLELVKNSAYQWNSRLQGYAHSLFWGLALIEFIWIIFPYLFKTADLGELLEKLLRFVMTIGFFATLLIYSVQWAEAIINSFRQAGATAAGSGVQLHPGDMFSLGVELAYTVADVNTMNPGVAISVALAALLILLCYAFIAAFVLYTLCESYVIINAGVIFIGFGGSQWTRPFSLAILRYAVSVGAKLFVLHLIVGLVMQSARDWQMAYQHDNSSMWTMVGLAVVCALLSKSIPDLIQGMITGTSNSGGSVLGGMAAATLAGATAGAAMAAQAIGGNSVLGGVGQSVADLLKGSGSGSSPGGSSMNMNSGGSNGPSGPPPRPSGGIKMGSNIPNSGPAPVSGTPSGSPSGSGSGTPSGTPQGSASGTPKGSASMMAHAAAELGIKTFGTATSMAVPGAESAAGLSIGTPPSPPDASMSDPMDTPENIIKPAPAPTNAQAAPSAPAGEASSEAAPDAPQVIDTMSDLQKALDNRGKTS